jgi:hypothetical protein
VEGKVVVSRVIRRTAPNSDRPNSTSYEPIVVYHYEANEKKHTSSQLATCRQANNTAKNIDNQFTIGSTTVSDDPSDAVLLTGLTGDNYSPIGLGGLVVLISLTMFIITLVKRKRYPGKQAELRCGPVKKPLQISLR